ncbi:TIGR03086 family metal-binding protein [Streptomyces sp. NBC_01498]|uniref:TIGR03086 family metal-binding protein n=1 Tax=Streptomyces sp. NBC_01498 TaxID=2975870 RepID=UPI002E7C4916|nr:TIGR03086 family metal-binding protein [Streptomyces sp. NBC_01498]WTL25309.1 TIGR03086 family metal-binding protein [Streptomyces sp. NBC_01498]
MNDSISSLLETASADALPVLRGVRDDQLTGPTPCPDYDVRGLLDHLFQVVTHFQVLAAKGEADFGAAPERLGDDRGERFAAELAVLAGAWAAPGAEDGVTGAMDMPARTVGSMALGDVLLHSWDLARATGQPYEPDAAVVRMVSAEFAELVPTGRKMGAFGEPRPVTEDATPFDSLLALTGRDPAWQPSVAVGTAGADRE